jgi:hypothetical protein
MNENSIITQNTKRSWIDLRSPIVEKHIQRRQRKTRVRSKFATARRHNSLKKNWKNRVKTLPNLKTLVKQISFEPSTQIYGSSTQKRPYLYTEPASTRKSSEKFTSSSLKKSDKLSLEEKALIYGADEWVANVKFGISKI